MNRSALIAIFWLSVGLIASSQDFRDDLRLAEALRNRGDVDLALELLNKLDKAATPEQKKELPLELAKTRLRLASDEPDTGKRLALYREAQANFDAFRKANPTHPRVPEANLDIARVLNAIGKTELGQALSSDDRKTRTTLATQARTTLSQAFNQLKQAEAEMVAAAKRLPEPSSLSDPGLKKAAIVNQNRAQREIEQARFEMGINLYEQSETYLGGSDEKAAELLGEARRLLDPLASGPATSPVTWKAMAWQGRIIFQTEKAEDARSKFTQVLNGARYPAAAEGIRLARYFRLLAIREKPEPADTKVAGGPNRLIREGGEAWITDYRRYQNTPEGYGLKYLLAQTYLATADTRTLEDRVRNQYRNRARTLLRDIELNENEFSDRARRLKIQTMAAQGLFKRPLTALKTFEDYFIRAQFEAFQIGQDVVADLQDQLKKIDAAETTATPEEKKDLASRKKQLQAELKQAQAPGGVEKLREQRIATLKSALKMALALPAVAKMTNNPELANARTMYTFWALQTNEFEEAVRVGEQFIRNDPRAAQAGLAAAYVLQAYSQQLDALRAKLGNEDEAVRDLRARLLQAASYIEERWPADNAGDMARHTVGLQLMREENFPEAIKRLSLVSPNYSNFALVSLQLADMCRKAQAASSEVIPGDRDVADYRKRAMLALDRLSLDRLGPDPFTNQVTIAGKVSLMRDWFTFKRFEQMNALSADLLDRIEKLRLNDDPDKDKAIRDQLRFELMDLSLYARYGLAEAAANAGDQVKAASILDPLVDLLNKKDETSQEKENLKKNTRLASGILTVALRANLQQGKVERTDLVLEALEQVTSADAGGTNILQLLAFLIRTQVDELRKKGDAAELDRAIKGYSELLTKRTAKLKKTPDIVRQLAACYSSMKEHDKAAKELESILAPGEGLTERATRLLYVRELRLSGNPENIKKARGIMEEVMGTRAKPAWGARDLTALIEQGYLLHAEEKWGEAFALWAGLVKQMAPKVAQGGSIRDRYFEVYALMLTAASKLAATKKAQAERDTAYRVAAQQLVNLEKSWPDLGGETSKARFLELLEKEPDLKAKYDAIKK
jgi:hypothetical protein